MPPNTANLAGVIQAPAVALPADMSMVKVKIEEKQKKEAEREKAKKVEITAVAGWGIVKYKDKWKMIEGDDVLPAGIDTVIVKGGKLEKFGIQDGTYLMTDPGPMKQLAQASVPLLDYFIGAARGNNDSERKIVLANHYADAAYLGEFISRELQGTRLKNFFFLHSLGTFKAEGLDYPNKLMSEIGKAKEEAEKANASIPGRRFVRTRKVFRNKLRLHVLISHAAAQHRIQQRILTPAN